MADDAVRLERVSDDDPQEQDDKPAEPTVADLQAKITALELETEKRLNAELKARDEFWAKRREAAPAPVTRPILPDEGEQDPLEATDFYSVLANETDPAKVNKTLRQSLKDSVKYQLKKGGFVSEDEVNSKINGLLNMVAHTQKLAQDFPLEDKEFQSEVTKQIAVLDADPELKNLPEHVLHRLAATQAKNLLLEAGKFKGKESEEERYERISRQRGSRGRGQSEEGGDGLSLEEKQVAARWGITEKDYLASKNSMRGMRGANV